MSVNPGDIPIPRPDVSAINLRGVQSAHEKMVSNCNEIIDFAYDGISAYLEADRELAQRLRVEAFPKGDVVGLFVKQDSSITGPVKSGERIRTFFTRLEPEADDESSEIARADEKRYMQLHVPVGRLSIHGFQMPPRNQINEAYVHTADDDENHWYALVRGGLVYEYTPARKRNAEHKIVMPRGNHWAGLSPEKISDNALVVAELHEEIVNWVTVPQVLRTI